MTQEAQVLLESEMREALENINALQEAKLAIHQQFQEMLCRNAVQHGQEVKKYWELQAKWHALDVA